MTSLRRRTKVAGYNRKDGGSRIELTQLSAANCFMFKIGTSVDFGKIDPQRIIFGIVTFKIEDLSVIILYFHAARDIALTRSKVAEARNLALLGV